MEGGSAIQEGVYQEEVCVVEQSVCEKQESVCAGGVCEKQESVCGESVCVCVCGCMCVCEIVSCQACAVRMTHGHFTHLYTKARNKQQQIKQLT